MTNVIGCGGSATDHLKVLYIGRDGGTSRHRYLALQRCGYTVKLVDPYADIWKVELIGPVASKFGFLGLETLIKNHVLEAIGKEKYDVVWVDGGHLVDRSLALQLKGRCSLLVLHNLDHPFIKNGAIRWRLLRRALPVYDLFVTPRVSTQVSALARGARCAAVVWQAADEIVHRQCDLTSAEGEIFSSGVVFVGTWMPGRDAFMKRLKDRGVPLRIFGPRWEKAPEYGSLAPIVTSGQQDDYSYVRAISGAKIALCLLNSDNEDLHTTRSLEIPAIGTLLCAPRTSDHEALYRDGIEACFFDDVDQCADLCLSLLRDDDRRRAIAAAGHERALKNERFNENMIRETLSICKFRSGMESTDSWFRRFFAFQRVRFGRSGSSPSR